MCGIAGEVGFGGGRVSGADTRRMCERLVHRGPDEDGFHVTAGAALGIRRLRVIGLVNGSQPVYDSARATVCVFNGEIYNYRALKRELEQAGFAFKTNSDAEVIVFAYERWGLAFLDRLQGMFAIALHDPANQQLILARDRAGKKPLFYSRAADNAVIFSSELGSLTAHPRVRRVVSPRAVDHFLSYRIIPAPHTIYRDVFKVEPGTAIVFDAQGQRTEPYWRFDFSRQRQGRSDDEVVEELTARLTAAIETRLQSEVPLGAFLSGGLDSSLVTAILRRFVPERIHTFAVGFDSDAFNELAYSRIVADHCNTRHHEYVITAADALGGFDQILLRLGEPFAFPSVIASYFMSRLAKRHATVVLSGDGADELFCGYDRYKIFRDLPALPDHPARRRRVDLELLGAAPDDAANQYRSLMTDGLRDARKRELYASRFRAELAEQPIRYLDDQFAGNAHLPTKLDRALDLDCRFWLRDAQLVKIDIASMANAVEIRSPMLDASVVEFASELPLSYKLRGDTEKWVLKQVAARFLPATIVHRPKQELAVPLEAWLTTGLRQAVRSTLLGDEALGRGYFDPDRMRAFVGEFAGGNAYALWTMYVLERWHQLAEGRALHEIPAWPAGSDELEPDRGRPAQSFAALPAASDA